MKEEKVKLKKKLRSENWIQGDRELLKQLVKERYAAIENKSTDTSSNERKKKAWLDLEQKFNQVCVGHKRLVCQLKCQWVAIKALARKDSKSNESLLRELNEMSEDSKRGVSEVSQEIKSENRENDLEFKTEVIEMFDESQVEFIEQKGISTQNEQLFPPEPFSCPNADNLQGNDFIDEAFTTANNKVHQTSNGYVDEEFTAAANEESRHSFNVSVLNPIEVQNKFFNFAGNIRKKRKRSDNWPEEDKTLLKQLVQERLQIIENKNTDTLTNHRKKKAWLYIEKRFNFLRCGETRNVFQLKSQWVCIKMLAKKEATDQGKEYALSHALKAAPLSQNISTKKLKVAADIEIKNREELHALQMENERKKARNLDLEYEILLEKKMIYQKKLNGS